MTRTGPTLAALLAAILLVLACAAAPAGAVVSGARQDPTPTTNELPRTDLEAEQRDDGTTSAAPWVIGSGIAALASVLLGGTWLKRRGDAQA